ncbi:hypothetical protein [Streptomyces sp. LN245]|uniref:hypothetical protein n=1 Tax=Streptomyces sp. LN245 TaxID=3112975 RepID=UPI00371DCF78
MIDVQGEMWLTLEHSASQIWHAITVCGGTTGLADEIAIAHGQRISSRSVNCFHPGLQG